MELSLTVKAFYCTVVVLCALHKDMTAALEFLSAYSNENFSGGKSTTEFIHECPMKCRCNNLIHKKVTDCSEKQIAQMPVNISVLTSELKLFKNQISYITYNVSLIKVEILNVSDNNIIQVDKDWMSTLKNLEYLDLSKNYIATERINYLFSNLSLVYLNLSDNKLEAITRFSFYKLSTLKTLDISRNQIQNMDYNCFQDLLSLEILDLSFNRLSDLKYEWFKSLEHLKILNIRKNNLQYLSNVVFQPLHNLKQLDLSENSILSIGLLSFKGLLNLEILNLSSNNIGQLQEGIFRPLEKLKVIDLSHNPFRSIDKIFTYTTSLEILYLKCMSNFKVLTSNSLKGLSKLKLLDLSGSLSLSDINSYAFVHTKALQNLDISSSNLTYLKNGIFNELTKIETIKLQGNPWTCNCHLYWLLTWLGENSNTHLLSPSKTICHSPPHLNGHVLLDALDHKMVCVNVTIHHYTENIKFRVGTPALLQCQADGSPSPILTWITPQKLTFHWLGAKNNSHDVSLLSVNHLPLHNENNEMIEDREKEHFLLMNNGNLWIRNVERGDGGFYKCIASNPLSNQSVSIRLTLDYSYMVRIKIVSVLVGMATSFGFLLLTLISVLIKMILKQCGVKCPCRSGKSSPKTQQIRKILESMEHYKKQQLDRLRDNYNFQVQRIKDNCMQQMERLRESYSSQAERLRDIRDYGTLQIDRIRENYYLQVQRVRDYSTSQIVRLRENYLFQRNRIRKFSTHHLYKLRENYKLQQQHLNKILENLNIESCRNVCQRTDSIVFEPDITLENVFVPKICLAQSLNAKDNCDSVDNSSQVSAYFTPDEAGSELSGPESDEQESTEKNVSVTTHLFTPDNYTGITDTFEINNEETSNNLQPDVVVVCDTRTVTFHANETIV